MCCPDCDPIGARTPSNPERVPKSRLAVLSREVGRVGDGWVASEGGVAAVMVVEVEKWRVVPRATGTSPLADCRRTASGFPPCRSTIVLA